MNEITGVGVDLAKRVIQVHAVGADGKVGIAVRPRGPTTQTSLGIAMTLRHNDNA